MIQPCECGRVVPDDEHHCWLHHVDEHPDGAYRVCGECFHVFPTAANLEEALLADGISKPAADIFACPECAHDF